MSCNRRHEDSCMEMGMLPPKYPKGKEDAVNRKSFSDSTSNEAGGSPNESRRRGRPPKPGGKKDMMAQAQAFKAAQNAVGMDDENDTLFGISAFRESQSLFSE